MTGFQINDRIKMIQTGTEGTIVGIGRYGDIHVHFDNFEVDEYTIVYATEIEPVNETLSSELGDDALPERLAQEYVDARQKAWDMGAAFVDYKTWLEQRLAGVEVQRDAALARAQAAEERVKELSSRMAVLLQWEDSVKVIKGIPYPKTLEINIDWIVKHYEQSPIATGMVLGDLLDLFEERLGELVVGK